MISGMTRAILLLMIFSSFTLAQQEPQLGDRGQNSRAEEILQTACTVSRYDDPDEPQREGRVWDEEYARRRAYNAVLPEFFAAVPLTRDAEVLMPVEGVTLSQVSDTWGAARSEGRAHEGTDISAPVGTPIYSATPGYVYRIGTNPYGGNVVTVVGGAGVRYYYAHLSAFNENVQEGQYVTLETILGYVGNTGNAATTPPHLHFGVYPGPYETCAWEAENPYGLLSDRAWGEQSSSGQ